MKGLLIVLTLLLLLRPALVHSQDNEGHFQSHCDFVEIGAQKWHVQTHIDSLLCSSSNLFLAQSDSSWKRASNAGIAAYCFYPDSHKILYNGYAIRLLIDCSIRPDLKVASDSNFLNLFDYEFDSLYGSGFKSWTWAERLLFANKNCTFYDRDACLYREPNGRFVKDDAKTMVYWTYSDFSREDPFLFVLIYNNIGRLVHERNPGYGYSVRLIKKE